MTAAPELRPCGTIVPAGTYESCGNSSPIGWCSRPKGHDGRHLSGREPCNRPAGHEGDHRFTRAKDAAVLARWTSKP
jgi:hypothetical protein